MVINFEDKKYSLKCNMLRAERIEAEIGKPIMSLLMKTEGFIGVSEIKAFLVNGLWDPENERFVPKPLAEKIAADVLENGSYADMVGEIVTVIERDCPFFFRAD